MAAGRLVRTGQPEVSGKRAQDTDLQRTMQLIILKLAQSCPARVCDERGALPTRMMSRASSWSPSTMMHEPHAVNTH